MPLTLNGSGTVSGISAGGLPDGCIQSADLAAGVGAGKLLKVHYAQTDTSVTINTPSRADTGLAITFTPEALGSTFYIQANQFGLNGVSGDQGLFNLYLMRAIAGGTASELRVYRYLGNYTSNDRAYHGSPLGWKDTPSYSAGQTLNYHIEAGFYTGNYSLQYKAQEGDLLSTIFVYELGA
tara:strand:- start:114 stop:656 length:543 start_codon:yes stop_codon:yes gene_type:complete